MGQAEAQDLGLDGGPLYDPLGNYRHVANNWSDWASDPRHNPVATRTVDPQEMPATPVVAQPLLSSRQTPPPASQTGISPKQADSPVIVPVGVTQPPQ
jgi:outer membrane protein